MERLNIIIMIMLIINLISSTILVFKAEQLLSKLVVCSSINKDEVYSM
ncbi:CRPV-129 [Crowpox virus]|nr:CRPV-129 [Crowpox virus]